MKEDFEKNIKNKLSDFKIEPSAQVWLDVEDALHQRSKKRMASWWWITLPIFLFLISSSIWWMNNNKKSSFSKTTNGSSLKNIKTNVHKQKISILNAGLSDISSVERAKRIQENTTKINKVKKNNNLLVLQRKDHQPHSVNHVGKGNNHLNTMDQAIVLNDEKNNKISTLTSAKTNLLVQAKAGTTDSLDKSLWPKSIKKDSSLYNLLTRVNNAKVPLEETTIATSLNKKRPDVKTDPKSSFGKNAIGSSKQKDSLFPRSNTAIKNDYQQIINNKHQWFITAAVGFITVKEGTSLFSRSQNFYSTSPSTSVGSGNNSGNSYITPPNNGYSFEAGIAYSQTLSKRWGANAGLQYRYLQNWQSVGLDSLAQNTAQLYYSYIQINVSIKNYTHWLQLPVSLSYTFNPSSRYQLQLSGGGSIAWAFSEHWLITEKNNTSYPYHYNSTLNNRLIGNLHIGIGLNYKDKFKLSLLAEQSLTPIHKNSTEKFYWQQFSLQISKSLHLSSHQNKLTKK